MNKVVCYVSRFYNPLVYKFFDLCYERYRDYENYYRVMRCTDELVYYISTVHTYYIDDEEYEAIKGEMRKYYKIDPEKILRELINRLFTDKHFVELYNKYKPDLKKVSCEEMGFSFDDKIYVWIYHMCDPHDDPLTECNLKLESSVHYVLLEKEEDPWSRWLRKRDW